MIEIVPMDNAMKAEKTTELLRKAIDDGIRFITQGGGSSHALNIIKQLEKYNERNPGKEILFLNNSNALFISAIKDSVKKYSNIMKKSLI